MKLFKKHKKFYFNSWRKKFILQVQNPLYSLMILQLDYSNEYFYITILNLTIGFDNELICHHNWKIDSETEVTINYIGGYKLGIEQTLICSNCGKIKKLKL